MIRSGWVKRFIFDLVYFTGEKDLEGKPIARDRFPSDRWKAACGLRSRLIDEVEVATQKSEAELVWTNLSEVEDKSKIVSERFKDGEFEISKDEKGLIRGYLASAELPLMSSELQAEISELVG